MPLSPKALSVILEPSTEEREIGLITMTHDKWAEPIRLSTDATEWLRNDERSGEPIYCTKSRGEIYLYAPMNAVLPDSSEESPPAGKVTFSNVGRIVTPYLTLVDSKYPRVTLEVVLASSPDIVEVCYPEMDLSSANWDSQTAEVSISQNIAAHEPMPWLRFVPAYFNNITVGE